MSIMVQAKLNKESQVKLWAEAVNCSGFLVNVILKVERNYPAMEAWTGDILNNWFNCLAKIGIDGYVENADKI